MSSLAVFCLIVQGGTHDDVLLLATSLLRVVVKTVITMDRSLAVVVSKIVSYFTVLTTSDKFQFEATAYSRRFLPVYWPATLSFVWSNKLSSH